MTKVERVLLIALAALGIALISGTAYALLTGAPARKAARLAVPASEASEGIYEGIGRLRARTSDGAVVVATIVFPYDAKDRPFKEELASKKAALKAAALSYLSSQDSAALHPLAEQSVKAALRDIFNAELLLGAVDQLYLADFQVIP
jgi:flagellar basal body-associated protein FliL